MDSLKSHDRPSSSSPLRVLFVSSGNRLGEVSPIIKNQGDSLLKAGINLDYFVIMGKGVSGYLKNIFRLKKFCKLNHYDVVHAHYSLSGYVAALAGAKPLVVSLMGSDVKAKKWLKDIINFFVNHVWNATIVKSEDMRNSLGNSSKWKIENGKLKIKDLKSKIVVIPNGVDIQRFRVIEGMSDRGSGLTASECKPSEICFAFHESRIENVKCKIKTSHSRTVAQSHSRNSSPITNHQSREKIGFALDKYYLIWVSNPKRPEKNYKLAEDAVKYLKRDDIELVAVYNKPNELLPYYYSAADALLLTSLWEGSPNVIKEALACNCPIVSTDVGDVTHLIDGVDGCYLAGYDVEDFADKLSLVLKFGKRTEGRKRIIDLGIDSDSIASKLEEVYNSVISDLAAAQQ